MYIRQLGVLVACLVAATGVSTVMAAESDALVYGLRCEYRSNPLGIDITQPRLSWKMEAAGRDRAQSAYQIIVASSKDNLAADKGDLWDTGKVKSDQSLNVVYSGTALASFQPCWWKVRLWDEAGKESAWSEPAQWSMGVLKPEEWTAKWIGLDGGDEPADSAGDIAKARWIWFAEGDPAQSAPVGSRYFRKTIDVPAGRVLTSATAYLSGDNQGSLFVNGTHAVDFNSFKGATEKSIADVLTPGKNVLAVSVDNMGTGPNPAGLLAAFVLRFDGGDPVLVTTDGEWKASDAKADGWNTAGFDDANWGKAKDLGASDLQPWGTPKKPESRVLPARMLRREFDAASPVKRAMVYISGLGLYELYINGERIGDQVLAPGCTEYNKRTFYNTYDVTDVVQSGKNAVGVWLGNGRYYAPRTGEPTATRTYGYPKLLFQLRLEMADGSVQEVVSDESWKLTTAGPIRANNEYDGETYDARLEMPGWDKTGFDDSQWQTPLLVEKPGEVMSAQMSKPIKVNAVLHPVAMTNPKPGMYVFDMGQNMVGWCKLKVKGPAGTRVTLRHSEVVHDDGTLYLDNIRGAKVTDEYILKGSGKETYEPRFTYHGFRFVELVGYPGQPDLDVLEGCVVHDAVTPAGSFECSNKLVNAIYKNVVWGTRGNYRSMPTDCPQRDERQGWLGDRSEVSRGESFMFDTSAFHSKWICDMHDGQREDGSISDVCPTYWPLYNDNVTWPSTFVIVPGMVYDQYGDSRTIERHYDGMRKWIKHMEAGLKDDIYPKDNYGDWCVPPEEQHLIHSKDPMRQTPGDFLGTAYLYYDLTLMAKYAKMLGKKDDEKEYLALAERLKTAFNKKFWNAEEAKYANGAATTCVLPIAFGLVPEDGKDRLFQRLVDKIMIDNKGHTSTGLIGGQWLMRVLADNGRSDVAYTITQQSDYPSWGYMVNKNATTVWELWNGDTADPAMNSHNHVMLVGDLITWFYQGLAGIRPDSPGAQKLVLKPTPVEGLDFVKASWKSQFGQIFSEWRRANGKLIWQVTVPANSTAVAYMPTTDAASVTEGGKPVKDVEGIKVGKAKEGVLELELGSGQYTFEAAF
ncbi:MAG: glycoside hydrolase family 78 protein [Candidatus Hydrogenedentes bacterium]|nr:glycoside hydrolase family 78 protein [Candidatus Hydrogenedentota bacterium]